MVMWPRGSLERSSIPQSLNVFYFCVKIVYEFCVPGKSCSALGGSGEDLLRLVEHVSRTQGQVSTTANRMLQSATDVNI